MQYQILHQQALLKAKEYKKSESALLEILMQIDEHKVYLKMSYPSLHVYCTKALGLTDAQAYTFCGVARKSIEVPELKAAIDKGALNISNARRVVPILNQENKTLWVEKASTLSQRELEREIKTLIPETLPQERLRPVSENKSELKVTVSVDLEEKIKRVKDLLSQKRKRAVSLEEVLFEITEEYIQRRDPIAKAERALEKAPSKITKEAPKLVSTPKGRQALPAFLKHQINLKYQGRCAHTYVDGSRCSQQRWLEVHHKTPVSLGGGNTLDNLVLLCSGHHKSKHL